MIRGMKEDDLPHLIKMGERFYNETPEYKLYRFEETKLQELGWQCLTEPNSICLVYDKNGIKGMLAGGVYEQFFSFDLTASELFLFVEKNARVAQFFLHENFPVEELYNGQWQNKTNY